MACSGSEGTGEAYSAHVVETSAPEDDSPLEHEELVLPDGRRLLLYRLSEDE